LVILIGFGYFRNKDDDDYYDDMDDDFEYKWSLITSMVF
jgi:hypothetical protein